MNYVCKRILQLIPILIGITFLSFAMMRLAGSDAVTEMYSNRGTEVAQEIIDAKRAELGLDQPFMVQYVRWLGACCRAIWEQVMYPEKMCFMHSYPSYQQL